MGLVAQQTLKAASTWEAVLQDTGATGNTQGDMKKKTPMDVQ